MEGRSVFKSLFSKEGERYNAWLQLDLGFRDEKRQHPVIQYHQNYGFKLEDAVKEFPLKDLKYPEKLDLLLYSLKKGNRHQVEIEGNDSKFILVANPRYKTMNIYDGEGKRMKYSVLKAAQDLVKAESKNNPQTKSRSKGVKV